MPNLTDKELDQVKKLLAKATFQQQIDILEDMPLHRSTVNAITGVSMSSIQARADIWRPDAKKKYRLKTVLEALQGSEADEQRTALELRRLANQVAAQDADLKERAGKLVPAADYEANLMAFSQAVREVGERMARKKKLTGPQAQGMLTAALKKLRGKFA